MAEHYVRPEGSPPANGYSHAVAFSGPMVAVSGQVPLDADGRVVGLVHPDFLVEIDALAVVNDGV